MRTKLSFLATTMLACAGCLVSPEVPVSSNNPNDISQNVVVESEVRINCSVPVQVHWLLKKGTRDRAVWEKVFREIRGEYVVEEFLADWRVGDMYGLKFVSCDESNKPKVFLSVGFTTPRLGMARIYLEMRDGQLVAYRFSVSKFVDTIVN